MTSRGGVNRRKTEASKKGDSSGGTPPANVTPGLPEQDSEHDPTARSSHEPELPVADNPGDESEGPPGLNEDSDGESTVDYRNFDDNFEDFEDAQSEDDAEPDASGFAFYKELITREEFLQVIEEDKLQAFLAETVQT